MNATQHPLAPSDVASRRILSIAIVAFTALVIWGFTRTLPVVGAAPGLSPVEGSVIEIGNRLWHGENPYPDPLTDRAVAFLYPPLAPAILAAAYQLSPTLTAPRAVSFAAVVATAAVLFFHLRQRNGWRAGLLTALAWLAIQNTFCGYFFLARVDAVANFFLLTALVVGTRAASKSTPRAIVGAALLTAAAILSKQTAIAVAAGVAVGLMRGAGVKAAVHYLLTVGAIVGAVLLTLHLASAGWSSKFLFMAGSHPFQSREFWDAVDRLVSFDSILLLTLAMFGFQRRELGWNVALLGTLGLSLLTAAKWGGLTTGLAPVFLLWLGMPGVERPGGRATDATLRMVSAFVVLFLPLAILGVKIPSWGVAEAGPVVRERIEHLTPVIDAIRRIPGSTLVNGYQELAFLAGKRVDDDLHAALECDLAGIAALTRIEGKVARREYALFAGNVEDLTARAAEVRASRPEAAARLESVARALTEKYQDTGASTATTKLLVPQP